MSLLRCVIGISNLTCPKLSSSYPVPLQAPEKDPPKAKVPAPPEVFPFSPSPLPFPAAQSPGVSSDSSLSPTLYSSGPQPFWHQELDSWKTAFPRTRWWGDASGGDARDGSGSNVSDGEQWGAAGETCLPAAYLLLCCPVPNRLRPGIRPRPGGWGPLPYITFIRKSCWLFFQNVSRIHSLLTTCMLAAWSSTTILRMTLVP